MVAGVRRAREPQHHPRCLARSRRSRWSGGASVGRAIVRGRCGALKSTVASFRRVVMFDLQHGAKSCRAGSLALCRMNASFRCCRICGPRRAPSVSRGATAG